jgi:chromosome segregation ATPase
MRTSNLRQMASEPTDESVSVSLPPELADWIDQQAAEQDTDREAVLVQLLSANRAAEEMHQNGDIEAAGLAAGSDDIEATVRDVLADRMDDIATAVADQLDVESQVADAMDEQFTEVSGAAAEQATDRLEDQLADFEDDFMDKVEDVRDRVIQVKKETDRKAPAEHSHTDLEDQIDTLAADVEDLRGEVSDLRMDLEKQLDSHEGRLEDIDENVWDVQEKLRTVAHVVNDLRESEALTNKRATSVDQIKRAAAEHDLDRARCEACGEGVEIALMTDPECPHCEATVTDVKPGEGFLGKPMLVKAQGIEAADDEP